MNDLHRRLAGLSPAKRTVLEMRLKEKGLAILKSPGPIQARAGDDAPPLSFAQQRLWFLDQLEPESPLYNIPKAVRMSGRLDEDALRKSLDAVIARHQVLRTTFANVDGRPVQAIARNREVELRVHDLGKIIPATEREAAAQSLLGTEALRPFDLSSDLMLRALLLRLGEEDHILLLTMHHIASDGWSIGVLFNELTSLYEAFALGKESPLEELAIQYADFALWQREWLRGDVLESQLEYWKKQLAGMPPLLELPTDRPRPPVRSSQGAWHYFQLPDGLTGRIAALGHQVRSTAFMTLLAAFQILLYRYAAQEDIAVGTPIAGRNREEIERLIGFFVNTLVLRVDLSGDPTFRELLHRVRDVAFGAYAHQDLPFEKLVEELQPDRNIGDNPLFQVFFAFQNMPRRPLHLAGLTLKELDIERRTAKFDLSLTMFDHEGRLRGAFSYNTDLFDAATIARMAGHFQTLLQSIAADPDQRISRLPLLTGTERRRLLVEWNDTKTDIPKERAIHERFEEQVKKTPESVAVVFEERRLTYRDLDSRANRLARYLRKLGVRAEVLVAICMERSLDMIVGLLAVLKAGGAYLPLDPEYPKERLKFILEDARPAVLLTQQRLIDDTRWRWENGDSPSPNPILSEVEWLDPRLHVVCLDADEEIIARESESELSIRRMAQNLAYVIYTSGSTGRPKGVAVEERQLLNYAIHIIDRLNPEAGFSFALVQPLMFDASLTVIFSSLLTGGTLHVISRERAATPDALGDYFRRWPMDFLKMTPSHLAALLASAPLGEFMPRRCLVLGGEEARRDWVRSLQSVAPGCTIINHYGPTETTVAVLTCTVEGNQKENFSTKTIPIGRPLGNVRVYLLDSHLEPVPVGVSGQLYVGGDNTARGYLDRPELTAERFIPDPFGLEPGSRLYRTGDLARYLRNGDIEFLGRIDHQVKIRGFRVELGEIETVLRRHPAVQDVVILMREQAGTAPSRGLGAGKRPVAYITLADPGAPSVSELRRFLKEKLPEYMVPAAFVMLDALPLTPNGKVDRKALPEPNQARPEQEAPFLPPSTPAEKTIAEIWGQVLKVDKVGIHDNFFDLGGHSLLATQVVSRLREAFSVELPLRSFFERPTVAGLASAIENAGREIESGAAKISPVSRRLQRLTVPWQAASADQKMESSR